MYPRGSSKALFLIMCILLTGLLAGCGGGDESKDRAQDRDRSDGAEKQSDDVAKKGAPRAKMALGTIVAVNAEKRRLRVRPSADVQGEKAMVFKIRKNAEVTLNDEQAEVNDIRKGQQAQIEYVVVDELNRARRVMLFSGGEKG